MNRLNEIAELIATALITAKKEKMSGGGVFMRSDMGPVIFKVLEANAFVVKKKRKGMPAVRKRDEIFDQLAKLDGQDPAQLTRQGAARIATAKKQILEVLPDKTIIEVMAEIDLRWAAWCKKHFDAKVRTVMALVTHWGELGGGARTKSQRADVYQDPEFDWKKAMATKYAGSPFVDSIDEKRWADVPLDIRKQLLEDHFSEKV